MNEHKSQPIGQQQIPTCNICNLQPSPQSSQHPIVLVIQVMLLFYSLKLSVIAFLLGYCFAQTRWLCPQCKRQIEIGFEVAGSNENIILKIGNCMIMLSKIKFRIIAGIIIAYLAYLFVIEYKEKPKYVLEKTWKSLANNCGYQAYVQNQFRANSLYSQYPRLGQWSIDAIFLRQTSKQVTKLFVKMDPTQYKNNMTEDIVIYRTYQTHSVVQNIYVGDVLKVSGQWQGREDNGHVFRFVANRIQNTGNRVNLNEIKLISAAQRFIRVHEQQQKAHQNRINNQSTQSKRI